MSKKIMRCEASGQHHNNEAQTDNVETDFRPLEACVVEATNKIQ